MPAFVGTLLVRRVGLNVGTDEGYDVGAVDPGELVSYSVGDAVGRSYSYSVGDAVGRSYSYSVGDAVACSYSVGESVGVVGEADGINVVTWPQRSEQLAKGIAQGRVMLFDWTNFSKAAFSAAQVPFSAH